MSKRRERYPGPRSFKDDEIDQSLFFGRDREIKELLDRVRATRMLVLFGKSGLGKTSLLQAGLFRRLRDDGFFPVPVRFDQPETNIINLVIESVLTACEAQGVDCESGERTSLWEFFKSTDLWQGERLLMPVLVLDQFEEVFTLQEPCFRVELAVQLRDLMTRNLPPAVRERRAAGERLPYNATQPDLRIILSLREEYVGALEELVTEVPAILEHRYQLRPLDEQLARRAVVEPALVEDQAVFRTTPFRFEKTALNEIMRFLTNRLGEVEPFQLQLICQDVERRVLKHQEEGQLEVEVDESLLGQRTTIEVLLDKFYRGALWGLRFWQRWRAGLLCERGLLSADGHRVSMEQGQIRRQFKVSQLSLDELVNKRLLHMEARSGLEGFYYELSHDSLIMPVLKARRRRTVSWRVAGLLFVPAVISLALAGILTTQQFYKEKARVARVHNVERFRARPPIIVKSREYPVQETLESPDNSNFVILEDTRYFDLRKWKAPPAEPPDKPFSPVTMIREIRAKKNAVANYMRYEVRTKGSVVYLQSNREKSIITQVELRPVGRQELKVRHIVLDVSDVEVGDEFTLVYEATHYDAFAKPDQWWAGILAHGNLVRSTLVAVFHKDRPFTSLECVKASAKTKEQTTIPCDNLSTAKDSTYAYWEIDRPTPGFVYQLKWTW